MKRWPEFRIAVGMDEKGYYWIEKRGTARQFAGDPKNTNRDYNSSLRGVAREQEQKQAAISSSLFTAKPNRETERFVH